MSHWKYYYMTVGHNLLHNICCQDASPSRLSQSLLAISTLANLFPLIIAWDSVRSVFQVNTVWLLLHRGLSSLLSSLLLQLPLSSDAFVALGRGIQGISLNSTALFKMIFPSRSRQRKLPCTMRPSVIVMRSFEPSRSWIVLVRVFPSWWTKSALLAEAVLAIDDAIVHRHSNEAGPGGELGTTSQNVYVGHLRVCRSLK